MRRLLSVFLLLSLIAAPVGCRPPVYRQTQVLMGTFVEVVSPDARAASIVFAEIKRIEGLLSKYREDSEVSQLNRNGTVKASQELLFILERSKFFYDESSGAFDVTAGPLIDLWGFTDKKFRRPADDEILQARARVGTDKIVLNRRDSVVEFTVPGMKIDLGAIAKGYAVDCAVARLRETGVASCLINAGGQIFCLGTRAGRPWKVAIRDPRGTGESGFLQLQDRAAATSGDYEQLFEDAGKRSAHILDPRT
ncbi:MAG: FAD:protein FMN transferase, partial [Candidatus Omnitrophica bacterium]|nr:FAD:protein FMN transferase [Candidatus Omnitrophota bacterium]